MESKHYVVDQLGGEIREPDAVPSVTALPYDPTGPDRGCGGFSTQAAAQAFFEAAGGPESDPHRLDANSEGVVCESLP